LRFAGLFRHFVYLSIGTSPPAEFDELIRPLSCRCAGTPFGMS
jgi:hypothetical protein